ncbi:MAG: S-layer homology domain-containing protein [Eubacteriales bacterium]
MRNGSFKRLLSGVLASAILAVGIPAVFAKEYEDVPESNPAKDEIDILSDIGVIVGTSATEFSPDESVTREQMALLLFRLMLNKADGGRVNTSPFKDLYDDTYHGAISWASAAGYILGTSESTFEPMEGIMLQDAMAMLVRALGQASDSMNNGYPWTYIDAAIKLGLDRGLENLSYTEQLTRAETAVILFNALTAEYLIPKTLSNGLTVYESTTIIEKVFGYEMDEATLVATNDYSLNGTTVIKNGYVTLSYTDDNGAKRQMTVNFEELGLPGRPNDYLGRSFKVMYSINSANKLVSVLSTVETSDIETYTNATVNSTKGYVTIGGTNYTIVESYSDALATNSNELLVFAYENDRTLSQIKTLEALNERLGLYQIDLIFHGDSDTASVAVLRNYQVGVLKVDGSGKINLANNLKINELTGGYTNKVGAENGEYVLYYFNSQTKELVIHDVLDMISGIVTRITGTSAKIDGQSYTLGNAKAGISASSISSLLTIGAKAQVAVYNGSILAVVGETVLSTRSEYLVAMTAALPVFANGEFRYVVTANIDGVNRNIYVNLPNVEAGKVYRYVLNNDIYTLIAPETDEDGMIQTGLNQFVQNGFGTSEIAVIIDSANKTTISKAGHTYFTLSAGEAEITTSADGSDNMKFVTDNDTSIVVISNGQIQYRRGSYHSAFTVADGAHVVAVFKNEVGSVETLRYLYISDGSLGNYDAAAQTVRLLALSGIVYENNTTYIEYQVFNYATGEIESRLTTEVGLTVGEVYAIGSDGTIVDVKGSVENGVITGYTESTVTIGEETYNIYADTKIVTIDSALNVKNVKLQDAYGKTVDFVTSNGSVSVILVK